MSKFKEGDIIRIKPNYEDFEDDLWCIEQLDLNKLYAVENHRGYWVDLRGIGNCYPAHHLELVDKETKENFLKYGTEYNPKDVAFKNSKYWNILDKCSEIAKEREQKYDTVEVNFKEIKDIVNQISKKHFTEQDIIDIMIATKLSRRKTSSDLEDNDVDLINYVAIGLHLKKNE